MSDTITQLVGNFNLKKEVDWGLLGVIADAFREEGNDTFADLLQLCVEKEILLDYYSEVEGELWTALLFCWQHSGFSAYQGNELSSGTFNKIYALYSDSFGAFLVEKKYRNFHKAQDIKFPSYLNKVLGTNHATYRDYLVSEGVF